MSSQMLTDVLQTLPEGEAVKMKQFLQVNEYSIIDKSKKGMHPDDNRYLFDWKKMSKLSAEGQTFFKRVELGLEHRTKGWYQLDPVDKGKKMKEFIGFSDADVLGYFHVKSAIIGFNDWIESETETIRYKDDNRKVKWCKVKILNLSMNNSNEYPVPTIMNIIYRRVDLPNGIL